MLAYRNLFFSLEPLQKFFVVSDILRVIVRFMS